VKSVSFKFNLDEKVVNMKTGFKGIVTLCAIQGDPASPEIIYYVSGAENGEWHAERLLKDGE